MTEWGVDITNREYHGYISITIFFSIHLKFHCHPALNVHTPVYNTTVFVTYEMIQPIKHIRIFADKELTKGTKTILPMKLSLTWLLT